MIPIILLGGGGHCVSCIDVIESTAKYSVAGILDVEEKRNTMALHHSVIGIDADIGKFKETCENYFITIGHIKNPQPRILSFQLLKHHGVIVPTIISPIAYCSPYGSVGEGSILMHRAMINANAKIGLNTIINTGAVIEHDAIIGDHTHISTGVFVNGGCKVGDRVFIGSSSVIAHNLSIADDVIIGAGSVVIHSITESGTYVGNPARRVL